MEEKAPLFDSEVLESMNAKAVQNQFFTPDNVYIDLGLFKDIPVGVMYANAMKEVDSKQAFLSLQQAILPIIPAYQKRLYDTVNPFFSKIGYTDQKIDALLADTANHDGVFIMSPATKFLDMLIRHTIVNQNNSRPANKYTKIKLEKDKYIMQPENVTYHINTYPLTLSAFILEGLGKELGESLGVDIKFLNQDPATFNNQDWVSWLKSIDCFYLDSLGRFTGNDFILEKQGNMEFTGCYIFGRKRFERQYAHEDGASDFEHQLQLVTAQLDILCDFAWLQNRDIRLTEEPDDIPVDA